MVIHISICSASFLRFAKCKCKYDSFAVVVVVLVCVRNFDGRISFVVSTLFLGWDICCAGLNGLKTMDE